MLNFANCFGKTSIMCHSVLPIIKEYFHLLIPSFVVQQHTICEFYFQKSIFIQFNSPSPTMGSVNKTRHPVFFFKLKAGFTRVGMRFDCFQFYETKVGHFHSKAGFAGYKNLSHFSFSANFFGV